MVFEKFRITATPHIIEARCKCGNYAKEVSNGWLSSALYCPHCETVYELKMVKVPDNKISKEFLEQCREECNKP
jgi:uncharacterized radical SAM superfamily protein